MSDVERVCMLPQPAVEQAAKEWPLCFVPHHARGRDFFFFVQQPQMCLLSGCLFVCVCIYVGGGGGGVGK